MTKSQQKPRVVTQEEADIKKGEKPTAFQDGWSKPLDFSEISKIIGTESLQGRRFIVPDDYDVFQLD